MAPGPTQAPSFAAEAHAFLLDSAREAKGQGRWSFMSADPVAVLAAKRIGGACPGQARIAIVVRAGRAYWNVGGAIVGARQVMHGKTSMVKHAGDPSSRA